MIYYVLAFIISWAIWSPLVAASQGWLDRPVPVYLHALGFMGPMLAAISTAAMTEGSAGLRRLLRGVLRYRVGARWYLVVLFLPPLLFFLSAVIARLLGQDWPDARQYGRLDDMFPGLGLFTSWVCHLLVVGFGEEVGWRGYALPRLQKRRNALAATLILSIIWGVWHLPTFVLDLGLGTGIGFAFIFGCIGFGMTVLYTWLYNSSAGSILLVSLWSTCNTLIFGSGVASGSIIVIMNALILVLAMIIARRTGAEYLSHLDKQID